MKNDVQMGGVWLKFMVERTLHCKVVFGRNPWWKAHARKYLVEVDARVRLCIPC